MRVLTASAPVRARCPPDAEWRSVAAMGPVIGGAAHVRPPGLHAESVTLPLLDPTRGRGLVVLRKRRRSSPTTAGVRRGADHQRHSVTRTLQRRCTNRRPTMPRRHRPDLDGDHPLRAALASAFDTMHSPDGRWSAGTPSIHRRSCSPVGCPAGSASTCRWRRPRQVHLVRRRRLQ